MDYHNLKPLPTNDKVKKISSSFSVLRNAITILLVIISLFIAVIMVTTNISRITIIVLGIISIFIFWFALDNFHVNAPIIRKK
ncbi:glucan phosphoethanolaminetransferase (alkaline phosphatase superfamily) [Neobacillus ginsengisoli]|uniref:Glucan phosphoethanolaminetransferase (Alkaline phosphatase superfamily) n=1 Tax=Neobacillus ginsengisoli TaxID=904295 RepID=A0ABT9Y066_9BACI|nr:glucan phosphoethanolaminetransferase (alkaline phosphatase superfamily) [Neobacillus ginsengisoli]